MTNPTTDATYKVVAITPALARTYLARNARNRSINERTVARYASDMANGRWQFAADPIRFDRFGNLLDGQHRLSAIAQQADGFQIDMLVVTKLDATAQTVMDQGRARTPGNQLEMLGFKNPNELGAGIRLYLQVSTGRTSSTNTGALDPTKAQICEWALAHRDIVDQAHAIIGGTHFSDARASACYGFALMALQSMPYGHVAEFFRLLRVGTGEKHPINALDKRLQSIRRRKVTVTRAEELGYFITAANAWLEGRPLTRIDGGRKWTASSMPRLRAVVA